jgi:hypothetical protein
MINIKGRIGTEDLKVSFGEHGTTGSTLRLVLISAAISVHQRLN